MKKKALVFCASLTIALAVFGARLRDSRAADKAPAADKAAAAPKADDKAAKAKPATEKAPKAAEEKAAPAAGEVTLKGEMTCAKCGLHETKDCQNVLRVKEAGGKETKYYMSKNAVSDDHHKTVCKGASPPTTVTGKVGEEGGKKTLTPSAIKFD